MSPVVKSKPPHPQAGFSDKKLTRLANRPFWEKGLTPWMAWESERTGFGLGIRVGGFFPSFLPLAVKSDHYADPITAERQNETNNEWGLYLTWFPTKAKVINQTGGNAVCIKHPWRYLGLNRIVRPGSGSLVFLPHSHGSLLSEFNWENIRVQMSSLDSKYFPLTICLGEQDINLGLHKIVREELGLPVVTAGDLKSQLFPFRFWSLLSKYRYTVGFNLASHTIYCLWAGRPFRLLADGAFSYLELDPDGQTRPLPASVEERLIRDYPDTETRGKMVLLAKSLSVDLERPSDLQNELVEEFTNSPVALDRVELAGLIWGQLWKNRKLVLSRSVVELTSFTRNFAHRRNSRLPQE